VLREDAVARNLGAGFNSFLSRLADRCAALRNPQPISESAHSPRSMTRSQ